MSAANLPFDRHRYDTRVVTAAAIIVVEAMILILAVDAWFFGVAISIAAVAAVALRPMSYQIRLTSRVVLTLAILCVVKLVFAPYPISEDSQFIRSQFAHELARFLLMTQVLILSSRSFPTARASLYSQLSWIILILSCDVRVPGQRQLLLQVALALAIVLNGLFGLSLRRRVGQTHAASGFRIGFVVVTILLSLAIGTALASAVRRYERELEWMVSNYLFPANEQFKSTGFSGQGRLDSITVWQEFESDEIVLQAVSDESPNYVAGRVFDTLETRAGHLEWSTLEPSRQVRETLRAIAEVNDESCFAPLFGSPSDGTRNWTRYEFWSQTNNLLFLPLETQLIAVYADRVTYSEGTYFAFERTESGELHYLAYEPSSAEPAVLSADERALFLKPHLNLDPAAAMLAEQIFANADTTDEKCRAVVEYLQTNYEYARGVRRPQRTDQISDFLLHNRQGHCEYFATAATLLLRLGNVPARYVTGYVMNETNSVDGSWIARNKDAHAWAIAYDDQLQQWHVVEATPAGGVPTASDASWWDERRLAMSLAWRRWLTQVREVGLLPSVGVYLGENWLIPLIAILSAIGFTVMIRRWSHAAHGVESALPATPTPWLRLLRRIDHVARRRGFKRAESETLQSFAARIQSAGLTGLAEAYRDYARMRYSRRVEEPQLAEFRSRVKQLGLV